MSDSGRPIPWFELGLVLFGSCAVLFVIAPLVGLFLTTTVGEVSQALADEEVQASMRLTLSAALIATLISTLAGVPLAWILARKRFVGRSLVTALIDLPVVIPHSAAGIALLTVIGRHSLLAHWTGGLVGTRSGIAVAMAFVSIPFLVNAAREAFVAVPVRLERAARTLGASPSRVFFTISLPMAWRGVLAGMILMWARGISEFGAVIIIAYHPMTTPVLIFQRFTDYGLSYVRSISVLLIVVCVAVFVVLRIVLARRNGGNGHA